MPDQILNPSNYQRTIHVNAPQGAVFEALTTNIAQWWTSDAGSFKAVGDIARFGFAGKHGFWTFKAMELNENRIEWECIEALHIHEGQPKEIETEWLGTRVVFAFEEMDTGTKIRFEHRGLTPDLLCYEICEAGWDMFFVGSLKSYLNTGKGAPFGGE